MNRIVLLFLLLGSSCKPKSDETGSFKIKTDNAVINPTTGETETIRLKRNEKLLTVSWRHATDNLWVLTEDTISHTHYFRPYTLTIQCCGEVKIIH